jgi:acyl-CoA oxidase
MSEDDEFKLETRGTNSINLTPAPDPAAAIAKERDGKLDPVLMHQFIEGREKLKQIVRLFRSLERDPVLRTNMDDYELSRDQARQLSAARINRMARYIETDSAEDFSRRLNLLTIYDPLTGIRMAVNLGLYVNCIKGNGTAEQYKYWCITNGTKDVHKLYGCFGMTELGHGLNVAGCETTAEFDEATDEFVINTPHIGATKWWIGGAAHSATHLSVYARLKVKGKDYGVKTFVVPLRDADHELLPGVAIGDIGSKMGREGVDNGWIQFTDVRIPRFFMLQKFCKVSRRGEVKLPPLEQLAYISLLGGRVGMAVDLYRIVARFVTVATRYGVGRRQFQAEDAEDEDLEVQLMDYPLHQRRLVPILALTYAMALGTANLETEHATIVAELDKAVAANDMTEMKRAINGTKSLFIDSGSLKLTCTWLAADCITECRQTCGGHGYSAYAGFGKAYDDWVVQCTWEGDNNVLGMSVGKSIVSNVDLILKGRKIDSNNSMAFLNYAKELSDKRDVIKESDFGQSDFPAKVLSALEVLIVKMALSCLNDLKQTKGDWDQISHQRVTLSKLRCHHYLLTSFINKLRQADHSLNEFLVNMIQLYANYWIFEAFCGEFILYDVLSPKAKVMLSTKVIPELCAALRPLVILLTDSFQQPDMILNSALGNYDGNFYENYFGTVKLQNEPINSKATYSTDFEASLNRKSLEERQRFEQTDKVKEILLR